MKKMYLLILLLAVSTPLASHAFDWGTAIRSYSVTQSATARSQSKERRLIGQLTWKIDNGDEIFVTESTRKERFANRFEQALAESGMVPPYTQQTTSATRVEKDGTVAYELWDVILFTNREGTELLAAERYFLFCDKGIIGTPGVVYYDMTGGTRVINKVYLLISVYTESEYRGNVKKAYEATCHQTKSTEE